MQDTTNIGRLLSATAQGFVVGCRIDDTSNIGVGSLVRVETRVNSMVIFGLVHDISYQDDGMVRMLAVSSSMSAEQEQDQIQNRQVPVEMSVLAVGYEENGQIHQRVPPRPPFSLERVMVCNDDEVKQFSDQLSYLRLILRQTVSVTPMEQLLVSHLVRVHQARQSDEEWIRNVTRTIINQLRDDHATLIPVLEVLSDALPTTEGAKNE